MNKQIKRVVLILILFCVALGTQVSAGETASFYLKNGYNSYFSNMSWDDWRTDGSYSYSRTEFIDKSGDSAYFSGMLIDNATSNDSCFYMYRIVDSVGTTEKIYYDLMGDAVKGEKFVDLRDYRADHENLYTRLDIHTNCQNGTQYGHYFSYDYFAWHN
ncbi:hypothetical protein [Paucisalibacillus sp. EB02]|uniref:hypothetical protein n=1 Tax=Paucisalibacillus sp. EB02 TaxID=1347087 RepID=UPI0004B3AA9C|nr:hypothetical protein [Paucisalibacillus sp. EB02]